jgi:RNA polymerase sigma-70 factor (ECF subfamily)
MRRYNQRVFRAARSVLRNDAEAADVAQETFVRAYLHLAGFEERSSVATWLVRIAVHEALSRLRRRGRFDSLEGDAESHEGGFLQVQSTQPGPEEQASSRELRSILTAAIDALPDGLRTVFVLRQVEGLSTIETSEALGLSTEAVRVRFHRARLALRQFVEKQLGEEVQGLFTFAGARCDATVARVFETLGLPPPDTVRRGGVR